MNTFLNSSKAAASKLCWRFNEVEYLIENLFGGSRVKCISSNVECGNVLRKGAYVLDCRAFPCNCKRREYSGLIQGPVLCCKCVIDVGYVPVWCPECRSLKDLIFRTLFNTLGRHPIVSVHINLVICSLGVSRPHVTVDEGRVNFHIFMYLHLIYYFEFN